jgi:glycosyltransferase involved in cell wall biosynthesis
MAIEAKRLTKRRNKQRTPLLNSQEGQPFVEGCAMELISQLSETSYAESPLFLEHVAAPATIGSIALVGNYLPRRCGIATYTSDVFAAMRSRFPATAIDIWAMNDAQSYDYPPEVTGTIEQDDLASYLSAAREITARKADIVWIQHEFGIFGGPAGDLILPFIDRFTVPVAVALHTVLERADPDQYRVTKGLVDRCETLIVMAADARRILIECYDADPAQVIVIPHGVPNRPLVATDGHKEILGLSGREIIMTFGLLSKGKGIETVIAAMPEVVFSHPDALYLVLGATHPHAIAADGEDYRKGLIKLASELGVKDNVRFIDAFFETDEVLDYLSAADIYVTPYGNPAQVTSGTLAYAAALGKPIISTPYVHARELLSDNCGKLVDFGDSEGFAQAINALLDSDDEIETLRRSIYRRTREMTWPRLAEASMQRFEAVATDFANRPTMLRQPKMPEKIGDQAVARMSDATGIFQHSRYGIPDRNHGYCIDDNARALILACRTAGEARARLETYASFIDHGWNPDNGCFRNFMSFDRRWLEERGSEDSCGRAAWALGIAASEAPDTDTRLWAVDLFETASSPLQMMASPRARAFLALGMIESPSPDRTALTAICEPFRNALPEHSRPGWKWFEPVLGYDNARLCEVLIRGGHILDDRAMSQDGIDALEWLVRQQLNERGDFRAVGSDSFGRSYQHPLPYDQQPVEAWAMVDACAAAYDLTGVSVWRQRAINAYRWFLGKNDLGEILGDVDTGECFDGLIPTGVNRNRGAESILAFHLATVTISRHNLA